MMLMGQIRSASELTFADACAPSSSENAFDLMTLPNKGPASIGAYSELNMHYRYVTGVDIDITHNTDYFANVVREGNPLFKAPPPQSPPP